MHRKVDCMYEICLNYKTEQILRTLGAINVFKTKRAGIWDVCLGAVSSYNEVSANSPQVNW